MIHKVPLTDFHELNLDWILAKVKELSQEVADWIAFSEVKFADPIEWAPSAYYRKNTIVLGADGNSYISRVDVPVGIGVTDDRYWYKVGNYNAQIDALERDLNTVDGKVDANAQAIASNTQNIANNAEDIANNTEDIANNAHDINTYIRGKVLFVGDSYALPQYGDWVAKCVSIMGLSSDEYWDISISGSNIARGNWNTFLNTWADEHENDVNDIGTIILCGGINDSDANAITTLNGAIITLANTIKNRFPKARGHMYYVGWALDNSSILAGRTAAYRNVAQQMWQATGTQHGLVYHSGCETVLHNRDLIGEDGLHPNSTGGYAIARMINNTLKGGVTRVSAYETPTMTPVSGVASGNTIEHSITFGGLVLTRFKPLHISGASIHFSGASSVKIADVTLKYINKIPWTDVVSLLNTGAGGNKLLNCRIKYENNALYMSVYDINPSTGGFYDITVQEINVTHFTTLVNAMLD